MGAGALRLKGLGAAGLIAVDSLSLALGAFIQLCWFWEEAGKKKQARLYFAFFA